MATEVVTYCDYETGRIESIPVTPDEAEALIIAEYIYPCREPTCLGEYHLRRSRTPDQLRHWLRSFRTKGGRRAA